MKNHSQSSPNLFVIGAPKCGTTSIVHYLSQHPEIFVSEVKEPHYFNTDSGHRYYFNEGRYLELFDSVTTEHKYRCEGSVWYLYSRDAIDNILKFNPESKFVVMLRDPLSMYVSLHRELLFGGAETVKSPLKAWNLQDERKIGKRLPFGTPDPRLLQYGDVCKLGFQMQNAMSKIPSGNLHYIFLEDLKNDPNQVYSEILKFLHCTPVTLSSYEIKNPKKSRKSRSMARLVVFGSFVKRKLGIRKSIGAASAINKMNRTYNVKTDLQDLKRLSQIFPSYFKEDIDILANLTKRNLDHWRKME